MHAIVLVGGFGTRLRPLTDTIPKSMLTVGNEPIITRLVRRLERSGITTVTLSLGFLPDVFIAAFPDGRCGGVEMRYAVEPEPLDTAGAIRFAAESADIDETFVVVNGDVITDLDLAALVTAHHRFCAEATLHLTPVADPSAFGVVEIDAEGRVQRFLEKPAPGRHREPSDQRRHVRHGTVRARWDHGRRAGIGRAGHVPLDRRDGCAVRGRHGRLLARRRTARAVQAGEPRPAGWPLRRRAAEPRHGEGGDRSRCDHRVGGNASPAAWSPPGSRWAPARRSPDQCCSPGHPWARM